jgi:prephenate dehydrogenase
MPEFLFNTLIIWGVGLMGGSLARALRHVCSAGEIIGVERTHERAVRVCELGIVDRAVALTDQAALGGAVAAADLIVLAAPVGQSADLLTRIAPHLNGCACVTDVGSTKTASIVAARAILADRIGQFVPAHPIAGGALSGPDAALDDLYAGCNVILCPLPENSAAAIARIAQMWRAVGARVHTLTPEQHDAIFASVSHLPHVLAFALFEHLLTSGEVTLKRNFAGRGFQDFTRIAASNPEMWRDICLTNRSALMRELNAYQAVLERLRAALNAEDGAALEALFTRAQQARLAWDAPEKFLGGLESHVKAVCTDD